MCVCVFYDTLIGFKNSTENELLMSFDMNYKTDKTESFAIIQNFLIFLNSGEKLTQKFLGWNIQFPEVFYIFTVYPEEVTRSHATSQREYLLR